MGSNAESVEGVPITTSTLLMSSSKHISSKCGEQNRAILDCKRRDSNPKKCLQQGQDVTRCVITLLMLDGSYAATTWEVRFELTEMKSSSSPYKLQTATWRRDSGAGYALFQFHELCEMPLGAADLFGLFKNFHMLALDNVLIFGAHNRSSAYRFVTLVDVMHEHRARFMCSAEGTPKKLFDEIVTRVDAPLKTATRANHLEDAYLTQILLEQRAKELRF